MPDFMKTGVKRKEDKHPGSEPPLAKARAAKSGNGGSASHASSADRDFESLLVAVADLSLEAKSDTREALGSMQHAILAPSQTPLAIETLAEAKRYSELVMKRKGEDHGPAHVRIALAGFQAMSNMKEFAEDEDFVKALQEFWTTKAQALSAKELQEEVHIFRAIKPKVTKDMDLEEDTVYPQGYTRILLRLRPGTRRCAVSEELEYQIIKICKKLKWDVFFGPAPRSGKERKVIDTLKKVRK